MKLSEVISEDLILCNMAARSKRNALTALIRRLVKSDKASDEEELKTAVLGRERLQSTGIGQGIAVPHGITSAVPGLACALAISRAGIKYGAIDNRPVHLIFLFVNNKARDVHYLSLLASVCRLFESKEFRAKCIAAESPREVLEMIRMEEARECRFLAGRPQRL